MSQFINKKNPGVSRETPSFIDDSPVMPSPGSFNPTTPPPLSEVPLMGPRISMPIKRSVGEQHQIEIHVSGEIEDPCTGPTTAVPRAISNITDQITAPILQLGRTQYHYEGAMPAMDVIVCAINQYKRTYKEAPQQLMASIQFEQQISVDMRDLYGQDFDGCTISSPFPNGPSISIFFVSAIADNSIVCMGQC